MTPEHKRAIWNHVRLLATVDVDYAEWAARWYAQNEPWLFKDMPERLKEWIAANTPEEAADAANHPAVP